MGWLGRRNITADAGGNRRAPRVEIPLNIAYSCEAGGAMRTALLNRTKNVSVGGVCIALYESLAPGTGIFLNFSLSDAYSVTVKGSVAWQAAAQEENGRVRFDTGVKFDELDAHDRKALVALIDRCMKKGR